MWDLIIIAPATVGAAALLVAIIVTDEIESIKREKERGLDSQQSPLEQEEERWQNIANGRWW